MEAHPVSWLARVLEWRSIENPNVPLSSGADELWDYFGATRTLTGQPMSERASLRIGAWYRGVDAIASDVAKIPCIIYRRDAAGKERATDHPSSRLVQSRPNDWQTAYEF